MFTVHNIPSFNRGDTPPPTSKMSRVKLAPFQGQKVLSYPLSRTFFNSVPPFQAHWHKSNPPFARPSKEHAPIKKMASHISMTTLTSQRCCSHCNSVHPTTSSTRSSNIRALLPRNDRQHPLTFKYLQAPLPEYTH